VVSLPAASCPDDIDELPPCALSTKRSGGGGFYVLYLLATQYSLHTHSLPSHPPSFIPLNTPQPRHCIRSIPGIQTSRCHISLLISDINGPIEELIQRCTCINPVRSPDGQSDGRTGCVAAPWDSSASGTLCEGLKIWDCFYWHVWSRNSGNSLMSLVCVQD